ncbi:MAG: hypothetical protein WD069_06165 [Planctomycetales bacterium]
MHSDDTLEFGPRRCPRCGRPLRAGDPLACRCEVEVASSEPRSAGQGDPADLEPGGPLAAIARFRSIAEAGFFADELGRLEIPATVRAEDQFDALRGHWNASFLLLVPAVHHATGGRALQDLIRRSEVDPSDDEPARDSGWRDDPAAQDWSEARLDPRLDFEPGADRSSAGLPWVPVVLALTAGSVIAWGLRHFPLQAAPQRPAPLTERDWNELRQELGTPDRPWTQPTRDGRGVRKLWFDRERNRPVIVEERPVQ